MKTTSILSAALVTGTLLLSSAGNAFAENDKWRYDIDRRQQRHEELIREGYFNGSLTWNELAALRREQDQIAEMERRAKANGRITWKERQEIADAQDYAAAHIFAERNDDEKRGRGWRWFKHASR